MLGTAKDMVSERFLTANVYFAVDRLVSGAVSQLQKGLQKVDDLLGNIPACPLWYPLRRHLYISH